MALFVIPCWQLDMGLGVLLCMCDNVPLHLVLLLNVATVCDATFCDATLCDVSVMLCYVLLQHPSLH